MVSELACPRVGIPCGTGGVVGHVYALPVVMEARGSPINR